MSESNPATDATRFAIECLTLWLEPGDAARASAAEHITRLRHAGARSTDELIAGLLNLSMELVLHLAVARGATDNALEEAGDILRHLSPRLPDEPG